MVVDGQAYPVDYAPPIGVAYLEKPFTSLLRGKVETVNTDLLMYDRWNAIQED
jgi:hypothetical protein